MAREEFKYGKLIAGEVYFIFGADVEAGEFKAGDLIETTDGLTWAKATAVAIANHYAVVAEDAALEGAGVVTAYKEGYFNEHILMVNGKEATAEARKILKTKNIFVTNVAEQ